MPPLWPHPPYAEDQPHAHSILTTHVLHRGFQTGALAGLVVSPFLSKRPATPTPRFQPASFIPQLLRSTGTGAALGTALMAVVLPLRMRGRADIEWRDRSWRLLENRGQEEVDGWSVGGAVAGAVGAGWRGVGGWRGGVGAVGVGSLAGVAGYLGWRYGFWGGKWRE